MKSILSNRNRRSYNVKVFVKLVLINLIFISCDTTDYVNDLGSVISPADQAKYQNILHSSISDTAVRVQSEWGSSQRLLAGTFDDYETLSVLKFNDFSDLPDTVRDNISAILLELTLSNTIGDSSTGTIDLFLYENNMDWEEDNLKLKSFNDFISSSVDSISSATVAWGSFDLVSNKITFDIPIELAESWMDSSATNGVILTASASGFIPSFHSRYSTDISLLPALQVTHMEEGDTSSTTTRIIASADGYVLNMLSDLPDSEPDKILIGGGAAYRSMVMIDSSMINSIPVNASIVEANLTLTIDRQSSLLPFSNSAVNGIGISLLFSFVDSTGGTDSLFVIDKTNFDLVALPIDGDEMTLDLTSIIQQWVAGTRENLGIALGSNSESSQIFRISLYGQNSSVSESMKPNIDIYYVNSPEVSD